MTDELLAESNSLNWTVKERPGYVLVRFWGELDENADFRNLLPRLKGRVAFNLAEVQRINSCGIREWVTLMRNLPPLEHLVFTHCSYAVVNQLNLIHNFRGPATIESFYGPYICETCHIEFKILLEVENDFPDQDYTTVPEYNCPDCQEPLTFDEVPWGYLQFLLDVSRVVTPTPLLVGQASAPQASAPDPEPVEATAAVKGPPVPIEPLPGPSAEVRARMTEVAEELLQAGMQEVTAGRHTAAVTLLRNAAELCPDRGDIHAHHGWAVFCAKGCGTRAVEEALPLLERAVALDPTNERAHLFLGRVYAQVGRADLARRAFEKALELSPDSEAAGDLERLKRAS